MKTHTIHEAKTNLSKLIQKAREGEEVIIAKGKEPVAKIVAIHVAERPRKPGRFKGKISWTEDAFDPLTSEQLCDWGLD